MPQQQATPLGRDAPNGAGARSAVGLVRVGGLAHGRISVVGVPPVQVRVEPAGQHGVVGVVGVVQHEVAQRPEAEQRRTGERPTPAVRPRTRSFHTSHLVALRSLQESSSSRGRTQSAADPKPTRPVPSQCSAASVSSKRPRSWEWIESALDDIHHLVAEAQG